MAKGLYFIAEPSEEEKRQVIQGTFNYQQFNCPTPNQEDCIVFVYASDRLKSQIAKAEFADVLGDGLLFLKARGTLDPPLRFNKNGKTFILQFDDQRSGLVLDLMEQP